MHTSSNWLPLVTAEHRKDRSVRFILAVSAPPLYALVIRRVTSFNRPYGLLEDSSRYQLSSSEGLGRMIYQYVMVQMPKMSLSLFGLHPRSVLVVSVFWQAPLVSADRHQDPLEGFMLILMISLSPFALRPRFAFVVFVVQSTSSVLAVYRED